MDIASNGLVGEAAEPQPAVVRLEERAWLARHCRGDAAAFPALLEAYRRPVYAYLVRTGVAEADRDDLFQSVFLKVHAAAGSYDSARPLAPWIFTIVANTVRNHFRDRPSRHTVDDDQAVQELADSAPGPERVAQGRQAVARLEAAMAALPLVQREVLVLTAIGGLRQQEVAEALELPLNTVKTNLRRARLTLAKALAVAADEAPKGGHHEDL